MMGRAGWSGPNVLRASEEGSEGSQGQPFQAEAHTGRIQRGTSQVLGHVVAEDPDGKTDPLTAASRIAATSELGKTNVGARECALWAGV